MNENAFYLLMAGAALAILGGAISDEIRAWRERARELKAIKIGIADELSEIESVIKNMHEVWEKSKVFHPTYVADLLASTSAYDVARPRLFLIRNQELRKQLVVFYKKLKDTAKKSEGKLGTLADTPEAIAEQTGFETSFQQLGTDAKLIKEKLDKLQD
jgi:hypothetical protein